jgi:Domain of unknown function (DUF4282)
MPEAIAAKKFFASLFDTRFMTFLTPKVIRVLYILSMIGATLGALGIAVVFFEINAGLGVIALVIIAPLYWLFAVLVSRIYLELIQIIFTIAEDLRAIRSAQPGDE